MVEVVKTGPFNRKPMDKRFVKQAVGFNRAPDYWTPMDLQNNECKIMEVKKYSAHYFDIDARFRRPGLELISAYVVQNPFLWGQYMLRREQMKMQLKDAKKIPKEKELFYATDFTRFEQILRLNFDPRLEPDTVRGVGFFTEALAANQSFGDTKNVKLMFMTKVLIGTCLLSAEDGATATSEQIHLSSKTELPIDTLRHPKTNLFYKYNMSEVYPDILLVYRDKQIPLDTRSCKLKVKFVKKGLRSGTRYNPDEVKPQNEGDDQEQSQVQIVLGVHCTWRIIFIHVQIVLGDMEYTIHLRTDCVGCT
ncbi:probable poly [ADP-ribose] polymerase DDB_G0278045 isoform X2 [Eurytemora carolleeae]|uniref:probable poly [ADP-ribose] polymerase DDB_G0278045 isoform X2 n=1 Tax=Eurytemora carolleeae TaxID=1294199 RepID=UPI000C77E8B9|nr:probable poly [ADP-ribose] polymerase DDB_G0278045 isoform X2 [Eurytemora carolleeae]|eukprot:XP_023345726.1 probable poly [ADP-ribose] polymerase DDB_G0278045 isoform X2 [Eurytemora affinis]